MKTKLLSIAASLAFMALGSSGSQADVNLIQNGGFEDPSIATFYQNYGTQTNTPYSGTAFDAFWTVTSNNVDIVSGPNAPSGGVAAYQGTQFLDLVGYGSTGGISQTFSTVIGQTYNLSFAYGNNPWSTNSAPPSALVDITSSGDVLSTIVAHDGSTASNINWTLYSGTFVAGSTITTLSFDTKVGGNNGGILLDAVSVSAVPELSTWVMMLMGFAGIGMMAYRRARKASSIGAIV